MKRVRIDAHEVPPRLVAMAYRALGRVGEVKVEWVEETRANSVERSELLHVAVLLEEAKLKGEPLEYVYERRSKRHPKTGVATRDERTTRRHIKAARALVEENPELQPQLEAIARERLSA